LARRCDLTEQIGARRRDIFATDTFIPRDKGIVWDYSGSPRISSPRDGVKAIRNTTADSPICFTEFAAESRADDTPITAHHSLDVDCPTSRTLDGIVSSLEFVVSNSAKHSMDTKSMVSTLYDSITSTLATSHTTPVFSVESFGEAYHCLYSLYGISRIVQKLAGNGCNGILDTTCLKSMELYHRLLHVPTISELSVLRSQISKADISQSSTDLTRLGILRCFLFHPIIEGYMKSGGEGVMFSPLPSSSSSLPPPLGIQDIIDSLSSVKKFTPYHTYQASIVSRFVALDSPLRAKLDKLMESIDSHEVSLARAVNENLHKKLFS
jgi:hypothetical protein